MKQFRYPILVVAVVAIGLLHFLTPGHQTIFHDTYRRLGYFPIVLGALWFGLPGGLSIAVLSSIAFIPHLIIFAMPHHNYLSEFTEILLYLAAGAVTGGIAGREARLRERYRQLSEKLEKSYSRLSEETRLLLEVEEQLAVSQRLSALGQLSASLAHEIKNPLGSIRGTGEILLDEFPPGHPKREFGEILLKEVGRLDSTVQEVLQYARGGERSGTEELELLSQILARVGKLLESRRRGKGISLDLEDGPAVLGFQVPGAKLTQVFLNLMLNSIEALPQGGRIAVRTWAEGNNILVSVSDNGPGVRPDDREKLFTPFFSGRPDGTGLGLAISRKIVESYGGQLTYADALGGGACFTVVLPQPDPSAALGLAGSILSTAP